MKSLYFLRLCLALSLGAVSSLASASATGVEQVQLPPMKGYHPVHQNTDAQGNRIAEYVPEGQTAQDWTDMVTVNDAPNSGHVSPRAFLGLIEAGWRIACPSAQSHWIRDGEEGGRPFALLMLSCSENPGTGKPEFTWIKGIQGTQGFHTVQKSFRSEPEKDDVVQWIGWLREVGLCGSGGAPACR